MAEERYEILFTLPSGLYTWRSPVMIEGGRLLKDSVRERIVGQMKIRNISPDTVSAVTVRFVPRDPAGRPMGEPFIHKYMDLHCSRDTACGQAEAVVFSDPSTRRFSAGVTEVFFTDGSVWTAPDTASWKPLPAVSERFLQEKENTKQDGHNTGTDLRKFTATAVMDLWYCGCGAVNRAQEQTCHKCGKTFDDFFTGENDLDPAGRYAAAKALLSTGAIAQIRKAEAIFRDLGDYKDAPEQAETAARLSIKLQEEKNTEASVRKPERKETVRSKRQKKQLFFRAWKKYRIPATLCLIAGILVIGIVFLGKKSAYTNAEKLLQLQQYDSAKTAYTELGSFRDSNEKVRECDYRKAQALFTAGQYEKAGDIFLTLGYYRNSAAMAQTCKYQAAAVLMNEAQYASARVAFSALGDYSNSAEMVNECDYQTAQTMLREGKYAEAKAAFSALGDYRNSPEMIKECDYRVAEALYEEGRFEEANTLYTSLGTYSDSAQKAETCSGSIIARNFLAATMLLEAGEYEAAKTAFLSLDGYSDSADKAKECDYRAATVLFEAGELEKARGAFTALGNYSDSKVMVKECDYRTAAALLEAGEYEQAQMLYTMLGTYADSAAQADHCICVSKYAAAEGLLEAGEYEQAKTLFAALGDYSDSADMVKECDYRAAQALYIKGDYAGAYEMFSTLEGYKDVDSLLLTDSNLAKIPRHRMWTVGNYVSFGTYPQTESGTVLTPINWLVLARDGSKALILSQYGLDAQPYNTDYDSVTWETCTLRKWLNEDFYNKAFMAEEQAAIQITTTDNSQNQGYPGYKAEGGINTQDRIFLLSYAEAWQYLTTSEARTCAPTDYAIKQGAFASSGNKSGKRAAGVWWLRSPGGGQHSAAFVYLEGFCSNSTVNYASPAIRPALWVDIDLIP